MSNCDRFPAVPLIASDPYLSIWSPADKLDEADTIHWCGDAKLLDGCHSGRLGATVRSAGVGGKLSARDHDPRALL